jgi:hypothetical protein
VLSGSDDLYRAIDEAGAKSLTVCELCGAPGVLRSSGWIRTLCDEHYLARTMPDKNSTTY